VTVGVFVLYNFVYYVLVCVQNGVLKALISIPLVFIVIINLFNPDSKYKDQTYLGGLKLTYKKAYLIHVTFAFLLFTGMMVISILIGALGEVHSTLLAPYGILTATQSFFYLFLCRPLLALFVQQEEDKKAYEWGPRTNAAEIAFTGCFSFVLLFIPRGYAAS
jgi:hypothetical protein